MVIYLVADALNAIQSVMQGENVLWLQLCSSLTIRVRLQEFRTWSVYRLAGAAGPRPPISPYDPVGSRTVKQAGTSILYVLMVTSLHMQTVSRATSRK